MRLNKYANWEDDDSPQFEKIIRQKPRKDFEELPAQVKLKRQPRYWQQDEDDKEDG